MIFYLSFLKLPNCRCYYFIFRVKYNLVKGLDVIAVFLNDPENSSFVYLKLINYSCILKNASWASINIHQH